MYLYFVVSFFILYGYFVRDFAIEDLFIKVKELKAGKIEDISADGANVAAIATVLPVFYKETYKDVYPVKGSKTYFKGAKPAEYEAASDKMRAAGMAIKMAAEKKDKAGVSAALEALGGSCGGCHKAFRGKY